MMDEKKCDKDQFWEYLDFHHKIHNSYFNFHQFVQAIERNSNQEIEETPAYRLLVTMLSDDKKRFKEHLDKGTRLYRGRLVDVINDIQKFDVDGNTLFGLNEYESKEPPLHTSKGGRSNIAGASYLYVSKDKYTAISECKPLKEGFVSVAEFQTGREMTFFNLCDNDRVDELKEVEEKEYYLVSRLIELLMRAFYSAVYDSETGYKVSQYITELVRKFGYDGIAYRSHITNGKNYTIFNCCCSNIRFVTSALVQVIAQRIDVVALNDGRTVENPNEMPTISAEQISQYKGYLMEKISEIKNKPDENVPDKVLQET